MFSVSSVIFCVPCILCVHANSVFCVIWSRLYVFPTMHVQLRMWNQKLVYNNWNLRTFNLARDDMNEWKLYFYTAILNPMHFLLGASVKFEYQGSLINTVNYNKIIVPTTWLVHILCAIWPMASMIIIHKCKIEAIINDWVMIGHCLLETPSYKHG